MDYFTSFSFNEHEQLATYSFEESNAFSPLSRINIFIGQNNSGKSRFLRNLFITDNFSYQSNELRGESIIELIDLVIADLKNKVFIDSVDGVGNIQLNNFQSLKEQLESKHINSNGEPIKKLFSLLSNASQSNSTVTSQFSPAKPLDYYNQRMQEVGLFHLNKLKDVTQTNEKLINIKRYYIPIIRGMRPFDREQIDFYLNRTLDDYFGGADKYKAGSKKIVFTGITLYNELKKHLLGEPEERELIKNYENFLSETFFHNQPITLIPKINSDTVYIKIGNEPQLPIYNLGDGLQNLIVITFNAFVEKEPCLFFIEEPDLGMHPGMQRTMIEVLLETSHQIFLTTHSNHLLDLTLDFNDISIFQFRKEITDNETKFFVKPKSYGDKNLLKDLGIRNSSVFLSNSTIWVEGMTDRLYLRTYMRKYLSELKEEKNMLWEKYSQLREDYDYSFVEYQGSNLVHWTFDNNNSEEEKIKAKYLCGEAILIADGDIKNKGNRSKVYSEILGDRYLELGCKEFENLIPEEILQKKVGKKFKELKKNIASIKYEDYSTLDYGLGKYLDDLLAKVGTFGTETTTIKKKPNFCEKTIKIMEEDFSKWELPTVLKDLCKKVFEHIAQNSKPE